MGGQSTAIIAVLLAHKADINAKAADGKTALALAFSVGIKEIAEFLRQHEAR